MEQDSSTQPGKSLDADFLRELSVASSRPASHLCFVGIWDSFDAIVAARPTMIACLDDVRDLLEDLAQRTWRHRSVSARRCSICAASSPVAPRGLHRGRQSAMNPVTANRRHYEDLAVGEVDRPWHAPR